MTVLKSLFCIDPGPEKSAWLVILENGQPLKFCYDDNYTVLDRMSANLSPVVIERISGYGMQVGAEVFQTCEWVGRYVQHAEHLDIGWRLITRRDVKLHLCDTAKANDANVRDALIQRYGGKEKAIGRKATPGALYGVTGDIWAALALAVTASETSDHARVRVEAEGKA